MPDIKPAFWEDGADDPSSLVWSNLPLRHSEAGRRPPTVNQDPFLTNMSEREIPMLQGAFTYKHKFDLAAADFAFLSLMMSLFWVASIANSDGFFFRGD